MSTLHISPQIHHVVAALIRRAGDLLLVKQQGPGDPEASWTLPGGVVEPGELLTDALAREVREETGLKVISTGSILYICQVEAADSRTFAFVFEVAEWDGDPVCTDPDGLVSGAGFAPAAEAIRLLCRLPYPPMRDPILAHLRGEAAPGALWCYRQDASGAYTLEAP